MGDGANIRVMMDPWLPTQDSGFITTPLGLDYEKKEVSVVSVVFSQDRI